MKKIITLSILAVSISLLSSCTTPYQAMGLTGGYKDMALNKNTYFVAFRGNGMTSESRVQGYVLRRAAELTIHHGYKYFVVVNGNTNVRNQVMSTPTTVQTQSTGMYQGNAFGNNYNGYASSNSYTTVNPGQRYNIQKYQAHIVIKMLYSNKGYPQALDAKIILSNFH